MKAFDIVRSQAQLVMERWRVPWRDRPACRPEPTAQMVYDEVTGLPASRLFQVLLSQTLADAAHDGRRVAVLVVDMSLDEPGAGAGASSEQWMMRIVAARAAGVLGPQDRLARIDADRLAVVVPDAGQAQRTPRLVSHLQQALSPRVIIKGRWTHVSCRIGYAISGVEAASAEGLLASAIRSTEILAYDAPVIEPPSHAFPAILPVSTSPETALSLGVLHS